jgi:hypothetical protein
MVEGLKRAIREDAEQQETIIFYDAPRNITYPRNRRFFRSCLCFGLLRPGNDGEVPAIERPPAFL